MISITSVSSICDSVRSTICSKTHDKGLPFQNEISRLIATPSSFRPLNKYTFPSLSIPSSILGLILIWTYAETFDWAGNKTENNNTMVATTAIMGAVHLELYAFFKFCCFMV